MKHRVAALLVVSMFLSTVSASGAPASVDAAGPAAPARWDHSNLTFWVEGGIGAGERGIVRDAFAAWQRSGVVSFTEVSDASEADVELAWSTYGSDGTDLGACTSRPAVSFGPGDALAGSITFNGECEWGSQTSLPQVAAREIGHALGLPYSSDPGSVLFRGFRTGGPERPTDSDLDELRRLYGASRFVALSPARVLDTRAGTGMPAGTVQRLGPDQHLDLWIAGATGSQVPASASAVVLNVTATGGTAPSYLTVYAAGSRPPTSNISIRPGRTVAGLVTVEVDEHGWISVFNAAGTVDVVADLAGYYTTEHARAAGLTGITPARLLDTRTGPGPVGALGQGGTLELQVAGSAGIPRNATAAVLNLTGTEAAGSGYVTAFPARSAVPHASNLNVEPAGTVANLVTVKLGSNGGIGLYSSAASVHLVVDVVAYYTLEGGEDFVPTEPERLLDTRNRGGPVGPQSEIVLTPHQWSRHVPATALTLAATTTAVSPTSSGYVTVYPEGVVLPSTSSMNTTAGQAVSNLVVAKLGTGGALRLFNATGTTHLIVDSAGYFTARGRAPAGTGIGSRTGSSPAGADKPPAPRPAEREIGWGHANLTYWIERGVGGPEQAVIRNAFDAWQRAGVVSFTEVATRTEADLQFVFYTHTREGRPFSSCSTEPAASYGPTHAHSGEVDLNGYCAWTTTAGADGYDLATIVAREIGHALGLAYSSVEDASIMSPVYRGPRTPTHGDLQRLRRLYGASRFVPVSPARLFDSRERGRRIGAGGRIDVAVAGSGAVPATASAVMLAVTATNATAAGHLSVFPADVPLPATSTLNTLPGRNVTNSTTVKLASNGHIGVYNSAGEVDFVVDVTGYFTTDPAGASGFRAVVPSRLLDTRSGPGTRGKLAPGGSVEVQVGGTATVPATATAALLNVTTTESQGPLYVTVFPSGAGRPNVSNVSSDAARTVGTLVSVKLGAGGRATLYSSAGAHLVVDVAGYFTSSGGSDFVPIAPVRTFEQRLDQRTERTLAPSSSPHVPAGASAILANTTGAEATGESFLTAWPDGESRPLASNLNLAPGRAVANQVAVGLGPSGRLRIWNESGSARVLVDLSGYFVG